MRKPGGYGQVTGPGVPTREIDSFTCFHCNRVRWVRPLRPPEEAGGLCKVCMRLVCPHCVKRGTCLPFEKEVERQEASNRFLRSAGIMEQGKP